MTISTSGNILTIGHSLVGRQIPHMMNSMGNEGKTDFQVITGAPLRISWTDHNRDHAQGVDSHTALATGKYDALILTEAVPLETNVQWNDTSGYALKFLTLAHGSNPGIQSYLYETWNGFDFFNGDLRAWRASLDRFSPIWEGVVDRVNAARPAGSKEMLLIPAGQAMANLYDAIEAGKIPGVTSIRYFFSDDIHPTDAGYYYVTMVHQATLYGKDPSGLPNTVFGDYGPYPTINPTIAGYLQDLAWETVNEYDRDGVNDGSTPVTPPVTPEVPDVDPTPEGIFGNDSNNTLNGTTGNDKMYGRGGNDVLDGKAGADEMHGGTGDDTYWVDNAGDRTIELAGQGRDTVNATVNWVLGANVEDLNLRSAAHLRGEGNSLDNRISGNSGNNGLLGMAGNDVLIGNEGDDTLVGGTGDDTLTGGTGRDVFRFTAGEGRDVITDFDARGGEVLDIRGYANVTALISENGGTRIVLGTNDSIFLQGVDRALLTPANFLFNGAVPRELTGTQPAVPGAINGNESANTLNGTSGNDKMYGFGGNDTLDGKVGADEMHGGTGDDVYWVDNVGDRTIEKAGEGRDAVHSTISWTLADHIEELHLRTPVNTNGTGNALDNFLAANAGRNVLSGLAGNDILRPYEGDDTLIGGTGNDTMSGGTGKDLFIFAAGDGRDVITDFDVSAREVLDIRGYAKFTDLISENGGTRVVFSSTDSIFLQGVSKSALSVSNFLFNGVAPKDLFTLPAGAIAGDEANNSLNGTAGNDKMYGFGGNDTLDGKAGADEMHGGTGNDIYWVDNAGDRTIELAGQGRDEVHATRDWVLGANIEDLYMRGSASTRGEGNSLDNRISGNSGNNGLLGMAGNDVILGHEGNDIIVGGTGSDTLSGGSGKDTFRFTAGDGRDVITDFDVRAGEVLDIRGYANVTSLISENGGTRIVLGTNDSIFLQGVDKATLTPAHFLFDGVVPKALNGVQTVPAPINGNDSANTLNGTSGNDKMYGFGGNDTLDGKAGADEMHGGTGNDVYWVDNVGDRVIERAGEGRDEIHSIIDWTLGDNIEDLHLRTPVNTKGTGNALDNLITANAGQNVLSGMAGNDTLKSYEGNDTLIGGTGNDTMSGGTGKDLFTFSSGDGRDVITDFDARGGEVLDIRGYANVTGLVSENGGTRVVLGNSDSIFLQGVDKATLTTENFLFNGTAPKALVGAQPPVVTVPTPTPAPEGVLTNPSMGIGLNGVSDWSSQMPFIDVFKSSRPWTGHVEGRWGGASREQIESVSDADGYLTRMPDGVTHVSAIFLTEMPAEMTSIAGTYRVTYEGEGEVVLHGGTNVRYGDGEIWFDYTPRGNNMISLDIVKINSGDHIRDISVVHQKNIPAFEAGKIFNPDWIEKIEDMRSLRFMDWQATNDSDLSKWADRAEASDATWTTEAGVPLEIMVKLANETGTDPWFNIPHKADAEFMRNFVSYVKENLDPDLKPSFEFSNEVWNWQFGQAQWANVEGQKLWPGQGDAWVQFYGMKAAEMATIVNQVYGPNVNEMVNKVIATHTAWRGLEDAILEAPNAVKNGSPTPGDLFNDYAITGYFDGSLGREKAGTVLNWISNSESAADVQGRALGLSGTQLTAYVQEHKYDQAISLAIRELRDGSVTGNPDGSIASLVKTFAYHKVVADKYGMDLVMYEGGTHVVGVGEWANNQTLANFFMALNQSDAMGGLYLELMKGWKDAGGTLFNAFVDVAKHGTYGSWGALQHLDDQSERWDAIVEFNQKNPGWWESRDPSDFIGTGEGGGVTQPPVTVAPTPVQDGIFGDDNANVLNGTSGNDKIYGRGGNDTLDGKTGADEMHGGAGNDVYWVDNAGDRAIEISGQGRDAVHATLDWVLGDHLEDLYLRTAINSRGEGNGLNNLISGNSGNNGLLGMAGNDTLLGNEGNDTLVGGTGNDVLTGGSGKDAFRFSKGDGQDVIMDFDAKLGELVDVRGYAGYTSLISENGGTRMTFEGGDSILFQGVAKADLAAVNFTFNGTAPRNLADVGPVVVTPPVAPTPINTDDNDLSLYRLGEKSSTDSWLVSDWNAGQTSNMAWSPNNVSVAANGDVSLSLTKAPAGSSKPYLGAEIQSNEIATTGTWSWTAQAPVMAPGAVFGMFTYKADWKNDPWVEFDFEFVGADTTKVQLAIHMENAKGEHMVLNTEAQKRGIIDLGFDASKGMHTYEVSVTEKDATFYVDGKQVAKFGAADMQGNVWQIGPMASFVDLWSVSSGQEAWAGKWVDPGRPLVAIVEGADIRPGEYGSTVDVGSQAPAPIVEDPAGIFGNDSNNTLNGTSGDDKLYGRGGDDILDGKGGADAMHGGLGNDVYWVDNANDMTFEFFNQGKDAVHSVINWTLADNIENLYLRTSAHTNGTGNGLDNYLSGNSGNNVLNGMSGNDRLQGHGGNDTLYGGAGKDIIDAGAGKDVMYGGADADVFVFRSTSESQPGTNRDVIQDFVSGVDEIDLSPMDANNKISGNQEFTYSTSGPAAHAVWATKSGSDMIVRTDVTGDKVVDFEFLLRNVGSLSADDFIL